MIKCDICGKEFNDKKNLGTHIKLTHQKDTGQLLTRLKPRSL